MVHVSISSVIERSTSDYEKWKQWFYVWGVNYKEATFSDGSKFLEVDGDTAAAIVEFDSQNNFVRMNASE